VQKHNSKSYFFYQTKIKKDDIFIVNFHRNIVLDAIRQRNNRKKYFAIFYYILSLNKILEHIKTLSIYSCNSF